MEIAELLDDARFGIVYSPDHAFLYEPEVDGALAERILRRTHQLYLADVVRSGERHRFVFPGEGEVPLREAVTALDAAGFQGFFSFKWEKIWNAELPDAREALPRFLAFMESIEEAQTQR